MNDRLTWEAVKEYVDAIKRSDAECEMTSNPIAVFHPDCIFDEFGGRTLQQVKDDGELPDYVILQRELPL